LAFLSAVFLVDWLHGKKIMPYLRELIVAIKGAGEMASAVAWRLYMANIKKILMVEIEKPLAVRRGVTFCEAIYDRFKAVEGVEAVRAFGPNDIDNAWRSGRIALASDPRWTLLSQMEPDLVVDAILAKRNLGTRMREAELVLGLGPGFHAGRDVHMVIETKRGHNLGRIITDGPAEPNTGIPGAIGGFTEERVLRSPADGIFTAQRSIGDPINAGNPVGMVQGVEIQAGISGVIRGVIRSDTAVTAGMKIGDVDPRGRREYCYTISEKARAIGGAVLEALMRVFNR
jgi:xanthine dehydrogenase accessory factor